MGTQVVYNREPRELTIECHVCGERRTEPEPEFYHYPLSKLEAVPYGPPQIVYYLACPGKHRPHEVRAAYNRLSAISLPILPEDL